MDANSRWSHGTGATARDTGSEGEAAAARRRSSAAKALNGREAPAGGAPSGIAILRVAAATEVPQKGGVHEYVVKQSLKWQAVMLSSDAASPKWPLCCVVEGVDTASGDVDGATSATACFALNSTNKPVLSFDKGGIHYPEGVWV